MAFIGQTGFQADATKIDNVDCEAAAQVGHWVYMSSGVALRALATSESTSNVIGVIEGKSSSTKCTVRFLGVTKDIYSALDETKEYYLSALVPGEMSIIPPTMAGHVLLKLGQPYTLTRFLVTKGIRIIRQ